MSAGKEPSRKAPSPGAVADDAERRVEPELIRARAYQIYTVRVGGARSGDALSDWLEAERELTGSGAEDAERGAALMRGDQE